MEDQLASIERQIKTAEDKAARAAVREARLAGGILGPVRQLLHRGEIRTLRGEVASADALVGNLKDQKMKLLNIDILPNG